MPRERVSTRKSTGPGQTIGGVLVGFDEQVWRQQPPAQERVAAVARVRTVVAPSGLTIELPEPEPTTCTNLDAPQAAPGQVGEAPGSGPDSDTG